MRQKIIILINIKNNLTRAINTINYGIDRKYIKKEDEKYYINFAAKEIKRIKKKKQSKKIKGSNESSYIKSAILDSFRRNT